MASREEERNRRIRKITSKDIEPGKELQEVTQAQNEISGINSELQNNLAMEQSEAQARNNNNNILRQAAEIGLMGAAGGAIVQQVGNFNPTTQQLLQKYGIKPGPPVNKVETKTTNQNFRSNAGGNTRIENTTNNTTNSRTDIKIVQPQIPMQQRQVVVNSQQGGGDANTARFKTWLSSVFAKQQNDYEVQKKEYRKREWNLNRSANRMMRRIETATKTFSEKMDPRNMGSSLSGQLKTLLFLFGTYMISKVWKPTMEIVANIETGFRSVFGLPINGDLAKSGGKTLSIIDSIKKFIGIDINTKEGRNTNLIEGIGKIFTQGIDRLIARIDLFLKDRQIAIKSVKFPDITVPSINLPGFGSLMDGIKTTLGGVSQYLGDMLSAAFGGSKGMVANVSNKIRDNGREWLKQDTYKKGVQKYVDDDAIARNESRKYLRKSDFDVLGNLKNSASSSLAMSDTLSDMMNDRSNTLQTGAVSTGIEELSRLAKRAGKVVINPQLLAQLGLSNEEISNLQRSRNLIPVQYKLIKKRKLDKDYDLSLGASETWDSVGGGLGAIAGAAGSLATGGGIIKTTLMTGAGKEVGETTAGLVRSGAKTLVSDHYKYKLVPADSEEKSDDGSAPISKTLYALTPQGFDKLKDLIGISGDLDVRNKEFVDWITKTLKQKKQKLGVSGGLREAQYLDLGEYSAAQARLGQYNQNIKNLSDEKLHPEWAESIRFGRNASEAVSKLSDISLKTLSTGARKLSEAISGSKQKENVIKAMNYFIAKGFSKEQAAGIVGNFLRESGMNPTKINEVEKEKGYKGYGRGIAQWSNDRIKQFKAWHQQKYGDPLSPEEAPLEHQLEYAYLEMQSRPAFMNAIMNTDNPIEAGDFVLRGFENGGSNAMASVADMNRVYGAAATKNTYESLMKKSSEGVLAALDIFDKSTGAKEATALEKIENSIGTALNKVADFIDPNQTKTNQVETSATDSLKNSQIDFRNKFFQDMYGAKIDDSGIYIDNGDSRVYLNPSSTSLNIDESSISSVVRVNKNGTIEPGDVWGKERNRIISDTIFNIQDMLISYEGKGTDNDYLSENGKPKWIYLGRFNDLYYFSEEAKLIYKKLHGIEYYILFSRDGKRVVRIKTTSIDYPWLIDNKPVKTGEYLYWTNYFKTPLGKVVSWNPLFTNLKVGLTTSAQIALDRLKKIVGADYKKLDDIFDKDFRSTVDNKNLAIRSGMVDEDGNITSLKASLVDFKQNFNESGFFKALGINKIEELQSRVESNPQEFYTDSDGKVYHKTSGLLVGQMKGDKFTAESMKNIQNWAKTNPGAMDLIREKILRETRSNELAQKGEIGYDKLLDVTTQIFTGIKDLGSDSYNYNKWLEGNKNVEEVGISRAQTIGGYKFDIKFSKDGSKIEAIRPSLQLGDDGLYHLITQYGSLDKNGFNLSKEPDWVSIDEFKKNPNIFSSVLPISFDSNNITGKIDSVNWDLSKLINLGDMNVSSFNDKTKNDILELNTKMKKEYLSNNLLGNDEEIQRLIKISRDRYLSGDTDGFVSGEDGKMFTKEGILFGRLGKDGNLGEVSNSDVFTELEKNLEFSKPDLYKKWFGAKEDGSDLVIENGNSRVVLDLSKPLTKDWTKIIKDVQWRENSEGEWEKVTNGSAGSTLGNFFGIGNSEEENKSKIIKDIKGLVNRRTDNPEWAEILEKNNGNVEEAMKELSKAEYESQDIQKQQLDNLQTQTKSMLDIQSIIAATAEKSGVDLSTLKFSLTGDTLGTALGNKTAMEGKIKEQKEEEEKRKQEEEKSRTNHRSPDIPTVVDYSQSMWAPQSNKTENHIHMVGPTLEAKTVSDNNKPEQ